MPKDNEKPPSPVGLAILIILAIITIVWALADLATR